MLTRTEFLLEVGLTRKALRIYEQNGLLVPTLNTKRRAFYHTKDVEGAMLIKALRQAGVPINQIKAVLRPASTEALKEEDVLKKTLIASANNAIDALEKLEGITSHHRKQVRKLRYGGCWALSTEAVIDKSCVAKFVAEFAAGVKDLGLDNREFAARYEEEKENTVKITCYKEIQKGTNTQLGVYRRSYIPEDVYYAVKAMGVSGCYSCFDEGYDLINEARLQDSGKLSPKDPIEIYFDYPHDQAHGQAFEALLLS